MQFLKILFTFIIAIISGFIFIVGISAAGSSHHISKSAREDASFLGFASIILGIILIFVIWAPWKKIFNS